MNIIQKIKLANKISKTIKNIKEYFKSNHIADEVREVLKDLEKDIQKLVKLIPSIKKEYEELKEIICPKKNK